MDQEMKEKVIQFITGELDEKEHREVFDWISSSSRNMKYYEELHTSMKAAEYSGSNRQFDLEKVRARVNCRIEMEEPNRRPDFRILFRVAASLLVILSIFTANRIIKERLSSRELAGLYQTIESPFGSRTHILLPDSTRVVLNAGSSLRYPVDYLQGEEREIHLSGEGFFEVRKRESSQFIVRVGDITLTALGTQFNVKAYPEENLIETTLIEGLLKINQEGKGKSSIYLRSNEKLSIIKEMESISIESANVSKTVEPEEGALPKEIAIASMHVAKEIDPVPEISWKDKEWIIRGKTMEEMSVMLERRYNVKIVLEDDEIRGYSFSGTLRNETLEQVLFAIRSTAPVDYKIDGNLVVLTHNKEMQNIYQRTMK